MVTSEGVQEAQQRASGAEIPQPCEQSPRQRAHRPRDRTRPGWPEKQKQDHTAAGVGVERRETVGAGTVWRA